MVKSVNKKCVMLYRCYLFIFQIHTKTFYTPSFMLTVGFTRSEMTCISLCQLWHKYVSYKMNHDANRKRETSIYLATYMCVCVCV